MNVLWFFLGTMFGSAFGFVIMALFQMHRINDYEEQIQLLEAEYRNKGELRHEKQ